jgi:hypothetical protein
VNPIVPEHAVGRLSGNSQLPAQTRDVEDVLYRAVFWEALDQQVVKGPVAMALHVLYHRQRQSSYFSQIFDMNQLCILRRPLYVQGVLKRYWGLWARTIN